MRSTERSTIAIAFGIAILLVAFLGSTADAQDSDFSVGIGEIDGELRIDVQPGESSVAALQVTISGLPASTGECIITELFGACRSEAGVVRLAGVHPQGLTENAVIARIDLGGGSASEAELVVDQSADATGAALSSSVVGLSEAGLTAPGAPFQIEGVVVPTATVVPPVVETPAEQVPIEQVPVEQAEAQPATSSERDESGGGIGAGTLAVVALVGAALLAAAAVGLSRSR